MYKVYIVDSKAHYHGMSLVAANNAQEAQRIIDRFRESDKNNECDSWGYENVGESDIVDGVWSEYDGIIYYGIRYGG